MVEIKGDLKFKKVNDLVVLVSDDVSSREWTRETLGHALDQIGFERANLVNREKFYKTILAECDVLKIKTEAQVAEEKRIAEEKQLAEEKRLAEIEDKKKEKESVE